MKKLGLLLLLVSTMCFANPVKQQPELEASGTRGGGEWVFDHEGNLQLRDLVDPSVCDYMTGSEYRRAYPQVDQIINQVARLDWYFAAALRYEINSLNICFTVDLPPVRTWDWDGFTRYRPRWAFLPAVRRMGTADVYVDKYIFYDARANDETRAYTIIHEALHGFIPWHAEHRNASLKAATKTIYEAANGLINVPRIFYTRMVRHSVQFSWMADSLRSKRQAIEFALADEMDRKQIFMATQDFNTVFAPTAGLYVDPRHQEILKMDQARRAAEILEGAGNDYTFVDKFLNSETPITVFDPLMVAFSTISITDDHEFLDHVIQSNAMKTGPRFFESMKNKDIEVRGERIIGTSGYYLLGITEENLSGDNPGVPALSVRPYSIQEMSMVPTEVQGLIRFISMQVKPNSKEQNTKGWDVVRALLSENGAFYAAFGVGPLQDKLAGIQSPIEREKPALAEALPQLVRGFQVILLDSVERIAGTQARDQMEKEIHWDLLMQTELKNKGGEKQ